MNKGINIKNLFLILLAFFVVSINGAFADHEALVAGEVVPLANASLSHGEGCDDVHYHGELNGKPDPDPDGCGHGIVTILEHDENGESIIPEIKEEKKESSSLWGRFTDWLDVAFQAISGGFSPKSVDESVDTVKDAAPSIGENIDTIDEYRESVPEGEDTLGIYNNLDDIPENPTLSQRFFRWFNNLTSRENKAKTEDSKQDSGPELRIEGLEGLKTR